ncbi:MAG: flagellar hook-basal body complex protein, partial [Desulfovibrio sp.]|nr:flagellar hook-basal body complex protein [Desulfovibrio sp.]
NSHVAVGQHGMGVRVEEIATNFTQGGFESTNSLTDLAINGKGYFLVQDTYGSNYYTRAGDFNVDNEGVLRNPNGLALMGYKLASDLDEQSKESTTEGSDTGTTDNQNKELQAIDIDRFKHVDAKATSHITITDTNLVPSSNVSQNEDNPYFSMLANYDATSETPLTSSDYSNAQGLTLYDQDGNTHEVTIYYDGTPQKGATQNIEFLVAEKMDEATGAGDGLLMSGILQFDLAGQLTGLSA